MASWRGAACLGCLGPGWRGCCRGKGSRAAHAATRWGNFGAVAWVWRRPGAWRARQVDLNIYFSILINAEARQGGRGKQRPRRLPRVPLGPRPAAPDAFAQTKTYPCSSDCTDGSLLDGLRSPPRQRSPALQSVHNADAAHGHGRSGHRHALVCRARATPHWACQSAGRAAPCQPRVPVPACRDAARTAARRTGVM